MPISTEELMFGAESNALVVKAVQQAVARAEAAGLPRASKSLPPEETMNLQELISAVPVHVLDGRRNFVRIAEIPEPFQGKFKEALRGSACPVLEGEGDLAYAWDWEAWTEGSWAGRTKAADFLER